MRILKRLVMIVAVALACTAAPATAQQSPTTPPQPQGEFIPLDQLPPQDQLPAPRLVIAAYAFVVATLFVYLLSVAKRLGEVRREVARLEADIKRSGRS